MAVLRFVELALQLAVPTDAEPVSADAMQVMAKVEARRTVKLSTRTMVVKVVEAKRVAESTTAKPRVNAVTVESSWGDV